MNDKIVITNRMALQKKYGADNLGKIEAAIKKLVVADKARGTNTRVIEVDNAQEMRALKAKPVTSPIDPLQNKNAVDAIYKAVVPDYLVLLGSVDVIPHQDLYNPLYDPSASDGDPDQFAFGDIPYACEAPYSKEIKDFIGPTRVVGRIPDITNQADPDYLIGLLELASKWSSRGVADYLNCFAITAEVWQKSSARSLQNTFGSASDLQICPPKGPKWSQGLLSRLSHFINCHGAPSTPKFFGQPIGRRVYPEADLASWIEGRVASGTVVAAECCYGAELYDPAPVLNRQIGICSTYLKNGGYGFFGSTTIAYGPSVGNGSADLIAQYFLQQAIAGSSLGTAALEARQQFAQSAATLGPEDLKTLAQFNLLGDPSIVPVSTPSEHEAVRMVRPMRKVVSSDRMNLNERAERRLRLFGNGIRIAQTQAFASTRTRRPAGPSIRAAVIELARRGGISSPVILSFDVSRPPLAAKKSYLTLTEKISMPTAFHVAIGRNHRHASVTELMLVIAKEQSGKIVSFRTLYSR